MSRLSLALGCLCLACAAGAALLARDVGAWSSSVSAGDRVYAATPARASWHPETLLGGAAAALLGVNDDVQLREALQRYVGSSKLHLRLDNTVAVEEARAQAQDALERVARSGDRDRASRALTLLGILTYRSASAPGAQGRIDAASSDFADALRADPGNGDAAHDLELVLRLAKASGAGTQPGQGAASGRAGRRGGGGGAAGSGY